MHAERRTFGASLLLGLWLVAGCAAPGTGVNAPSFQRDRQRAEELNTAGLALVERESYADAEQQFREALEADPFHGPAHCNLGVTLLQQGNYYEAAIQLRHAAKLMPRASEPHANLGLLYEAVGRFGEAEQNIRTALGHSANDIVITGYLCRILVRANKSDTFVDQELERVAVDHPDASWRRWAQGILASRSE